MANTYTQRNRTKRTRQEQTSILRPARRLGRLMLKQTATGLLCTAVLWGMHNASSPRLSGWTDALGRALRVETDFSFLQQAGDLLKEKANSLIPAQQEAPSSPLPDDGGEITEH